MKTTAIGAFLTLGLSILLLGCEAVETTDSGKEIAQDPVAQSEWSDEDRILWQAFENETRGLQVRGSGIVVKVLPDDLEGSKHQKFILELGSGQTLLVAHNIDLAQRLPGLVEGDTVTFYGEYEWNDEGGVVHWTHHDPDGRHVDGWLLYKGQSYS